ncbi:MAG: tetratricopeptide repeat protein [Anaerolineae bacterium]|nr:tetratricopeptide repeat protein [Anaerolineae bacterium]
MMDKPINLPSAIVVTIMLMVLFGLWHGQTIVSSLYTNVGFVLFNQALTWPEPKRSETMQNIKHLFQRSVQINPDDEAAWRQLGYTYLALLQDAESLVVWQHVTGMDAELITWGDLYAQQGAYDEALVWYQRAVILSPEQGDPWYYMGLTYQKQERWDEALAAYETAVQQPYFLHPLRSDAYFQQGVIYEWVPEHRNSESALRMYSQALANDQFSDPLRKAHAFYERGVIYSWQGKSPALSLQEYRQALALNPKHDWAQLRMGYALYWAEGDLDEAVAHINQIIDAWQLINSPHLKWAYRYLGDIYLDADRKVEALAAYEAVYRLDPADTAVREQIEQLREDKP